MAVQQRVVTSVATRNFRRLLYGGIGIVLSSYAVLFVLVVSRHLDHRAEAELRRSAAEALAVVADTAPSVQGVEDKKKGRVVDRRMAKGTARFSGGLGPSLLGMERFQERWAAVARILAASGMVSNASRRKVHVCTQPKFKDPPGPLVALASFPGSGNTWVRFLVQQATGFLTGSVYRDYSLLRNGFPAESIVNGSVVLVKTHEWGIATRRRFQQAVLLIRDPYGALLAEFNRRAGGHLGHAAPDKFHKGKVWRSYVMAQTKAWMLTVLDWLRFDGPLHVVRYEEMVSRLPAELARLLRFLNITVPWSTFHCVLRHRDGIFRRSKKPLTFDPFDHSLRRVVDRYKKAVDRALRMHEQGLKVETVINLTVYAPPPVEKNQTQTDAIPMTVVLTDGANTS